MPVAPYDEIADWYETEFLGSGDEDTIGVQAALRGLLGEGSGTCLEIGCGTGFYAARVRELGWKPVGVDLSAGMLRYARGRLPIARADAEQLPIRSGSVPASITIMAHTDMPGYPAVLRRRRGCSGQVGCSSTWACIPASAVGSPIAVTRRRW
jgi:ubiquinone/menaquinone biosynthesis C-methylase UbiE